MKTRDAKRFIALAGLAIVAALSSVLLFTPIMFAKEEIREELRETAHEPIPTIKDKEVVVYLDTMEIELKKKGEVVQTFPVVSKGKPGSYYETPGGTYISDYKVPLHFSSFGHVYLPYSVHIFGNFFIHGIPYYPNGERVSSSYSGGCIRVEDKQMKIIYDFVESGTPITIGYRNAPELTGEFVREDKMAHLMTAIISLEFLPQDDEILWNGKKTTRLALLPKLLDGNESVALFYAKTLGQETFIELMNEKAHAIGLHETVFSSLGETPKTSGKDLMLFYAYLKNHKSYLLSTSTTPFVID